jgi:NAD(P)-dependent dehydrogenase (short-subunit alcohol dehydrogenase family)
MHCEANTSAQSRSRFDLTGRVALVTGGASGIGRACAVAMAEQGAAIAVADRNFEGAQIVAEQLQRIGVQALPYALEVTEQAEVQAAVTKIAEDLGSIDILVHSAGVGLERKFLDTDAEHWHRLININLSGTFYVAQAVAHVMKAQNYGRIVFLSSVAGLRGGTGRAAYGASKGGVTALGQVMALELAEYGIITNMVAPGAIETELVAKMHDEKTREAYLHGIPMDRYGTPEEVADVVTFLASDAAAYVNGAVLGIDGGFLSTGVRKK